MTDTPVRPPVGRYTSERRRGRTWTFVGVGALVAAALGTVAWVGGATLEDPVQWKDFGFHVTDASSIEVTFDVTKAHDATASCRVRALSQSFGEVGVRMVTVGPSDADTQRVTVTIPTAELAVSGQAQDCKIVT